jgi:hypothetical protein
MFAAKQATTTVPIVFLSGEDPVSLGLVSSLAHPGGNMTGINFFNRELAGKQLEFLCEFVPSANRIAVLVNPADSTVAETTVREVEAAAGVKGLQVQVIRASTSREIDAAFAVFNSERPDGLFIAADPFFNSRRLQLSLLAMRHGVPTVYSGREYAEVGGGAPFGRHGDCPTPLAAHAKTLQGPQVVMATAPQTPIWSYVGTSPMRTVLTPINSNVATNVALRPKRSPKWPKITAPTGRMANPTKNVDSASSVAEYALACGKKSLPKMVAAISP